MSDIHKLLFAGSLCAAATALLWAGRLTGGEWVSTVTWVTAAYMLGQAAGVVAEGYALAVRARGQRPDV